MYAVGLLEVEYTFLDFGAISAAALSTTETLYINLTFDDVPFQQVETEVRARNSHLTA
jgi:hypothetical protein